MKKSVVLILAIILLTSQALAFEFCKDGTMGKNELRIISVDDMLKENSKEWTWQTLQEIEIEVRVENRGDNDATYVIEAIFKEGEKTIGIAEDSDDLEEEFSLSKEERKSISLKFKTDEDIDTENYDLYIKFYKKSDEDEECVENSEEEIEIEKIEICKDGNVDEDELEISSINDNEDGNENEWEWAPRDSIEISLKLENKDYSKRDFAIELIFLNEDSEEVDLADDSSKIYEKLDLEENEKDDVLFQFRVKPDAEETKYTLYIKAYDADNKNICTSLKAEDESNPITIDIKREKRKVIVTKIEGPTITNTSAKAQYFATITNLGNENEDRVEVVIYNNLLKIKERIEVKNLNPGETQNVTFNLVIPENASLRKYGLEFLTKYEYIEKQDYYKEASDEDENLKYFITVNQGEKQEEIKNVTDIQVEQNETMTEEPIIETAPNQAPLITGNAVGLSQKSKNWTIIIILSILALIGIILFLKKPKTKKTPNTEAPKVIRRYAAKLN